MLLQELFPEIASRNSSKQMFYFHIRQEFRYMHVIELYMLTRNLSSADLWFSVRLTGPQRIRRGDAKGN